MLTRPSIKVHIPAMGSVTYSVSNPPEMVEIFNEPKHTMASVNSRRMPLGQVYVWLRVPCHVLMT